MPVSEDVEWLNEQQLGRVWHMKNLPFAWGNLLIPLFSCYPCKKEVCTFLTLEGYFLCRNKSLDCISCLRTNPIQQAASPGSPSDALSRACLHQEGSSGAARRSWLAWESHNGKKTWLSPGWTWSIYSLFAPPKSLYILKQLMKESSYRLLLLICFIKGGNSQIHWKESDYIFYDRTWVTWHLLLKTQRGKPSNLFLQ